ncbi:hypothetical protein B484DRAFT_453825 [Ochromonadaceae sp. CCMP2298]|nr:hypothetical protein B484DRAFT_453825 [Ochromonadaceae sp. CCMP2298]
MRRAAGALVVQRRWHGTWRLREKDFTSLKTDLASLKTDLASLKTDLASLKTDFTSLKTDLASLEKKMETDFDAVKEQLEDRPTRADMLKMHAEINKEFHAAVSSGSNEVIWYVALGMAFLTYMTK